MRKPWYSFLYVRSPVAKIIWGIVSIIISMWIIALVDQWEDPRMEAQTQSWEGRSIEKGAATFSSNCSECHNADGKGIVDRAPALHSKYFFACRRADLGWIGSLDDYVESTLHAGRPSKIVGSTQWTEAMPTWGSRFGGPLRGDQVTHIVNYILNWEETAMAQSDEEDPWQPFEDVDQGWAGRDLVEILDREGQIIGYECITPEEDAEAVESGEAPTTDEVTAETVAEEEVAEDEPAEDAPAEDVSTEDTAIVEDTDEVEAADNTDEQSVSEEAGEAADTAAVELRSPQELWTIMACSACHNIAENQTEENRGPVGPHQNNLYERAGERVEGLTAEEYVYQSIIDPNAYVVETYLGGVMNPDFAERMSEEEIRGLVSWMLNPNREIEVP